MHIQLKQTYEFTLTPNSMHIWRLENVHSERQPNGTYFQFHPSSIVNNKHIHTAVYGIGHIVPLCSVLGCIVGITTHFQLSAVPFGCADASPLCVCVCCRCIFSTITLSTASRIGEYFSICNTYAHAVHVYEGEHNNNK